jgi:hypothetical protein
VESDAKVRAKAGRNRCRAASTSSKAQPQGRSPAGSGEVTRQKKIIWQYGAFAQGTVCVIGKGFDRCNAPYDTKVIGDYTGLAVPSGF